MQQNVSKTLKGFCFVVLTTCFCFRRPGQAGTRKILPERKPEEEGRRRRQDDASGDVVAQRRRDVGIVAHREGQPSRERRHPPLHQREGQAADGQGASRGANHGRRRHDVHRLLAPLLPDVHHPSFLLLL